ISEQSVESESLALSFTSGSLAQRSAQILNIRGNSKINRPKKTASRILKKITVNEGISPTGPLSRSAIIISGVMEIKSNKKERAKLDAAASSGIPSRPVNINIYIKVPIRAGKRSEKKFRTKTTKNSAVDEGLYPITLRNI